jgi:hypothetical protein
MAVGLAFLGPGRWSLDALIGLKLYGLRRGLAVLLVGVVAGRGQYWDSSGQF